MDRPTILLGHAYSLEDAGVAAEAAGVSLILTHQAQDAADRLGVPTLVLPSFQSDPGAADVLNRLIKQHEIDAFWPLAASAFDVGGVTACPTHPVTTPENYALVKDKAQFAEWLGDDPMRPEGVETFGFVQTYEEVMRRLNAGQAVIQKPTRGVNGSLYWEISPSGDLLGNPEMRQLLPASYEAELRAREAKYGPERWLVMDRLRGPEVSIDALCVRGELVKWMVRTKIGGGKQVATSDHEAIGHVRYLVKALGLHGLVSVQYMYDADGNLKLLEINLRPSGGCITYGDTVLGSRGTTSLLADWLGCMAGTLDYRHIKQWSGEVTFRTKTVAVVVE